MRDKDEVRVFLSIHELYGTQLGSETYVGFLACVSLSEVVVGVCHTAHG